eukprot:4223505-Prymnesium_polylepis.1
MLEHISAVIPMKLGVEGVPPNTPVVLKRTLFSWCRDVGRQVHIYIEDAVAAGYIIEGGLPPNEFVFCAQRSSATQGGVPPPMSGGAWPALGGGGGGGEGAFGMDGGQPSEAMGAVDAASYGAMPGRLGGGGQFGGGGYGDGGYGDGYGGDGYGDGYGDGGYG